MACHILSPEENKSCTWRPVNNTGLVFNTGKLLTSRRPGTGKPYQISLASEFLVPDVVGWKMMEEYTHSDHQYTSFQVRVEPPLSENETFKSTRWNVNKMDRQKMTEVLRVGQRALIILTHTTINRANAETLVNDTMRLILQVCEVSMPVNDRGTADVVCSGRLKR